jgi:probable HAF family extracellular repeat protein
MWPTVICLWLALRAQAPHRRAPRRRPALRRPCFRPRAEALEDRCLPSSYSITDLGTLGGPASRAAAINSLGEVVGSSDTSNYYWQYNVNDYGKTTKVRVYQTDPFLWKPSAANGTQGSMTDLGNFGGWSNGAGGINGLGQVVGASDLGTVASHAFLWNPSTANGTSGALIDLGTLGGTSSWARDINGSGHIAGGSDTSGGDYHAFLWNPTTANGTSGAMTDLGTVSGTTTSDAEGINDAGQIAGQSFGGSSSIAAAAFLYSGGQMIDLGHLGGGNVQEDSAALGINNFGQVVGESSTGPATHAFLWTPSTSNGQTGSMIDLGSLVGASGLSYAHGINMAGQVVGESDSGNGPRHAFLWTPTTANGTTGTMIDLNTLVGSSKVTLYAATGINDQGQIVGYGTLSSNGSTHAFLLTPQSTMAAAFARGPAAGERAAGSSGRHGLSLGPGLVAGLLAATPPAPASASPAGNHRPPATASGARLAVGAPLPTPTAAASAAARDALFARVGAGRPFDPLGELLAFPGLS